MQLTRFTKLILIAGLILVFYGYLCRLIGIYFFWESKSIGWILLYLGIISFLSNRIKHKKSQNQKSIFEKIVIGIIVFVLFIQTILLFIIPNTDAYVAAKKFVMNDKGLKTEVGDIIGFGIIPSGGIQKTNQAGQEYGNASINLTIKGNKHFKDVTIYVVKHPENDNWEVESFQ